MCYRVFLCVSVCFCVLSGLAAAQLHSMPPLLCFQCYPVLSCVTVRFCMLSGLAAAALLHTMPLISCYQCYPVFLCVIRVGSSTVTFHASDIVLSCVTVCYLWHAEWGKKLQNTVLVVIAQ